MRTAEEIAKLRLKLIERLEAAQAIADELGDGVPIYLIERALDELRASAWSGPKPQASAFSRCRNMSVGQTA